MPRPCAVITSLTGIAAAVTGLSAMSEHAGSQPLCAAYRSRLRPWCGRQMDRRRDRRAWRSPGPDPPQPQPEWPWRSDRRSTPLSRPAAFPDPITDGSRSYATRRERLFRSGPSAVRCRTAASRARRPRLICAPVVSPDGSTGPPCATTRRFTIASARVLRARAGRRCLPPSPISTAISPGSSAPGSIHGGRPRRRSPIRAEPSVICSATACASARRPTFSPPAKASRPCWRSNRCCRSCPMIAGLSANHLAALDLPSSLCAASMSRATTTPPAAGRRTACATAINRHRHSPARAGACRLQSRSLPSRRRHYARTSHRSARPGRPRPPSHRPARSAVTLAVAVLGSRRKEERGSGSHHWRLPVHR